MAAHAPPPPPPNLSYAGMLEEKALRKGFLITTLVSAVLGSFVTAINLQERVADKRRQWKQEKTDEKQNARIRHLEKKVEGKDRRGSDAGDSLTSVSDTKLRESLESAGTMIQKEFEKDFKKLGNRFAEGDLIAQTQLQSQIIALQSTVINCLQDALFEGKAPDISKLYDASETCRLGSIRALRDQYQRMLQSLPPQGMQLQAGPARPAAPIRRTSSDPTIRERSRGGDWDNRSSYSSSKRGRSRAGSLAGNELEWYGAGGSGPLFCRYAEDLQRSSRPLDRSGSCPSCGTAVHLAIGPNKRSREIVKEVILERHPRGSGVVEELIEERTYVMSDRFIMKCHRSSDISRDGVSGFACCLCDRYDGQPAICDSVEALAEHITRRHGVREYDDDPDLREVFPAPGGRSHYRDLD